MKLYSMLYNNWENEEKIIVISRPFIERNENKFKLIYNNRITKLKMYFPIKNLTKLKLKLIQYENISKMTFLFCGSIYLSEFSEVPIHTKKNRKIHIFKSQTSVDIKSIDESYIFKGNSSIKGKEDKPNIIIGMNYLFSYCMSLKKISSINNWNIENVKSLNFVFENCNSLKSLPDISNWNTKNVKSLNGMFLCCYNLLSLPDISKWNIENVENLSSIF